MARPRDAARTEQAETYLRIMQQSLHAMTAHKALIEEALATDGAPAAPH